MDTILANIAIINGPNLNLLGTREPKIYGNVSFMEYLDTLKNTFPSVNIAYEQSNSEGAIIDLLHEYGLNTWSIIINPGAYTHTSIAIRDAVESIPASVVEVHISNIYEREDFRKANFIKDVCVQSFVGHGLKSYEMAIRYLMDKK